MKTVTIGDVDFPRIFNGAGARGFWGEGYWYHPLLKPFGLDFTGSTLVTKTITAAPVEGNMPLTTRHQPAEWFPRCIHINPWKKLAVNAVGLSNPGIDEILRTGHLQRLTEPFVISLMAIGQTIDEKLEETDYVARKLAEHRSSFRSKFAVEDNYSCPNIEHGNTDQPVHEVAQILATSQQFLPDVPHLVKLGPTTPFAVAADIAKLNSVCALSGLNTLPFGVPNKHVPWQSFFGTDDPKKSPLRKRGFAQAGGLSGAPLLPVVFEWIKTLRRIEGVTKPIIAGGGVMSARQALDILDEGASAISIASICFLNPTQVRPIISACT